MTEISASVGSRARNRPEDVKTVQGLLNEHLSDIGRAHPLAVDGLVGRKTILAIVEFQSRAVGMIHPDARVDPGGRTLRALGTKAPRLSPLPKGVAGHYPYVKAANQFGTTATLASIAGAAAEIAGLGLEIGIGDISLERGGKMPGHLSHQRGVDVDIRPLRDDGKRLPVTINNAAAYSRARTAAVVKILRQDPNLDKILFNDEEITGVKFWPGHHNHLHVRFKA